MFVPRFSLLICMGAAAQAWKVKWYGGFTGCKIPTSSLPAPSFQVRVWESYTDSPACVPKDTTVANPLPEGIQCQERSYNNSDGMLIGTTECSGEIGRGSLEVVEGCCQFWDDLSGDETCMIGKPYLGLRHGECENQAQFLGFKCTSSTGACPKFSN